MKSTSEPLPKPQTAAGGSSIEQAAQSSGKTLRRAGMLAVVLIVAGAVAGIVPRWLHRRTLEAETLQLAQSGVTIVHPAAGKAAPPLLLPAELKPLVEAPIYARTSGYLKNYRVDIGAPVKSGDLLAEIDTPELDQELAQARAQQAQAEAALELARTTANRWTELLKTASVSEQETAEKKADFQLKTANLDAARANVRRLEEMQGFQKVLAPFDGTIIARNTDVGQLITAGNSRELFRLAQTGTLRVFVRVPQSATRGVAVDTKAELLIPERPGKVFPARVSRTSGAMNADSRTMLVELEVDNSRGKILSGSFAQARLLGGSAAAALTLPANTLLFRAEGPQVGVVGADGKVELHTLILGRDFGATVEVLGGVNAADSVILNPSDSLAAGDVVHVAEGAAEKDAKVAASK